MKAIYTLLMLGLLAMGCSRTEHAPNILFVFADQLRSQELSCYGGANIETPNLDMLAQEGLKVTNAFSTYPICSPYRGMLITGLYPMHSGISNNDHPLNTNLPSIAKACKKEGFQTAYIGKWHLDGRGRDAYIPPDRRLGFEYWQALECTHNYFESKYYDNNSETPEVWEGYDAEAQTEAAINYIETRDPDKPFLLMLAWGPPHDPYVAPEKYIQQINPGELILRPNVAEHDIADELWNNPRFTIPETYLSRLEPHRERVKDENVIRSKYAGYLSATLAIDDYFGRLMETLEEEGILNNTIVVFTSDHGDQLGSHQMHGKNTPFLESTSIPFLIRYPVAIEAQTVSDALLSPIDVMPTLLGLSHVECPEIDGIDLSEILTKKIEDPRDEILLMNLTHFNNTSLINGLDTWRGIQTKQYTYARESDKNPWLLFDNIKDPYQMNNLVGDPAYAKLISQMDGKLDLLLEDAGDPEDTKSIYNRIIKENPERKLLLEIREANPDLSL